MPDEIEDREDPRIAAAQYRIDRIVAEVEAEHVDPAERMPDDEPRGDAGSLTETGRAAYVEQVIQQAIRAGEFDDLPGAGKPLPELGTTHDPDWWIRRKIEREGLTGLGPPALQLRVEDAELAGRLDALTREDDVRAHVEDFNARVKAARMQLMGGPPVVTPLREVEREVEAWRARRSAPATPEGDRAEPDAETPPRRRRRLWPPRGRS
jgi:hypothetical protein